jgi:hypothetical protein
MGYSAFRSHREFANFLRIAATVESSEIRALLSLKQSAIEIDLPGFSEFREAILAGDRAAVSEVLGRAEPADREGMSARIPRLLGDELERRYLDVAREIVGATIDIPELFDDTAVRRQVMHTAADHPELRQELVNLRASEVLAAGGILDQPARRRLLEPYLDRFHDVEASEARAELAADIAPHLGDLSTAQRSTLRAALAAGYREEYANYLPLVEADPGLLPLEALDAAIEHLSQPGGVGPDPQASAPISSRDSAAIGVIRVGISAGMAQDRRRVLVAALGRIFEAVLADGEQARQDLPILTDLIASVELDDPQPFVDLARVISARWSEIAEVARPGVIGLAGAALSHCDHAVAGEIAREIAAQLFTNPTNALGVITSLPAIPKPFGEPLIEHLTALAARPEDWASANDVLRQVEPRKFGERAVASFAQLLRTGHAEQALELLARYEGDLEPLGAQVADTAAPILIERVRSESPGPVALLDHVVPRLPAKLLDEFATAYAEALDGPSGPAVQATLEEMTGKAIRLTDKAARRAIPRLEVSGLPLLDFVCGRVGRLPKASQEEFADRLTARLRNDPAQVPAIASALRRVRNLLAEPATRIVDVLLRLDRDMPDPAVRREIFAAVLALRKQKRSRVDNMLKERLQEMAQSQNEIDRQLATELTEQIAE